MLRICLGFVADLHAASNASGSVILVCFSDLEKTDFCKKMFEIQSTVFGEKINENDKAVYLRVEKKC